MSFKSVYLDPDDRMHGLAELLVTEPEPMYRVTDGSQPCAQPSVKGQPVTIEDRDRWYPPKGEPTREPVDLCVTCPFQVQCLHWGVWHEDEGVWGGVGRAGLAKIRKALGITRNTPSHAHLVPTLTAEERQARAERGRQQWVEGRMPVPPNHRKRSSKGYFVKDEGTAA